MSSLLSKTKLSPKDKKYSQLVEKTLATFDSLEEWADYIAFLSRLQKSLQLNIDTAKESYYVPYSSQVSNRLALCLSSDLPNGVHQKALSVYEYIFGRLPESTLNKDINIWLPGLLPLFSYSSILVKPLQIKMFRHLILSQLSATTLRSISKPFILCLLAGLDDENSEVFGDVIELLDAYKLKLNNDSHFWQSMFVCIIRNPERRLGALHWCVKRLPLFISFKDQNGKTVLSEEAQLCLKPEPGLLIRAMAISIDNPESFDVVVVRGFFDLMLSHIPLDSDVITNRITPTDREVLIMACSKITLRKDMSLNRRLWTYFLGPETEHESLKALTRTEYFKQYVEETLINGLLAMAHSDKIELKCDAFKILLPLIMDKWEIGNVLTPKLFSSFLKIAYNNRDHQDLMISASTLFDGVESIYIWSDIIGVILSDEGDEEEHEFDVVHFVLKDFNVNEEEMATLHVPFAILCLLAKSTVTPKRLDTLELLINLVSARSLDTLDEGVTCCESEIINKIETWYSSSLKGESPDTPFSQGQVSFLIVNLLQKVYVDNMEDTRFCIKVAELLNHVRNFAMIKSSHGIQDSKLVEKILNISVPDFSCELNNQDGLLVAFGISKLVGIFSKLLNHETNEKVLKVLLSNLWSAVVSSDPANHQVEAVRAIFELETCYSLKKLEAGLVELFLALPENRRVKAFEILWIHSMSINESDRILEKPLQLLLDGCSDASSQNRLPIDEFLKQVIKTGASNRLLKLITNPILAFDFIVAENELLLLDDDLGQFSYFLNLVVKVITADVKLFRDCFNNELAVMDSKTKITLVKDNNWNISTYKSLLLSVIQKFFKLNLATEAFDDREQMQNYYSSIDNCLQILHLLVTGNENDFGDLLMFLIQISLKLSKTDTVSPIIEAVQSKFLQCIFYYLERATELRLNLNLLHVEEQNKNPLLINFICLGILKSESPILLEKWMSLLIKSLYLFGESVFSVLLVLNDTLIKKIDNLFDQFSTWQHFKDPQDFESSVDILFSGLEDLLTISHSYLMTSNIKQQAENQKNSNTDNGFLNSVILGVFQIESPAIRSSEQNKLYSILLAFHDAVRVSFKIWNWSDSKTTTPSTVNYYSDRSLTYISHKLKFRARKLLESLLDMERQEVVESILILNGSVNAKLKLMDILDGGRPQMTLPSILKSILLRSNLPVFSELSRVAVDLDFDLNMKELSRFLVDFLNFIDNDSVADIWNHIMGFFKDVLAHVGAFDEILLDCLLICSGLSKKLASIKNRDHKYQKELGDIFVRLFNQVLNLKQFLVSDMSKNNTKTTRKGDLVSSKPDLENNFSTLCQIIPVFEDILPDSDKVSLLANLTVTNFIIARTKLKTVSEIPEDVVVIINILGESNSCRSWKTLVSDLFMDKSFFNNTLSMSSVWRSVINSWMVHDKERFGEIISRITVTSGASPSNLFVWNEMSEIENKANLLKRLVYLILVLPKDYFLNYLEPLFDKVNVLLNGNCPDIIRIQIMILFRAVCLKFNELHLLLKWTLITHELLSTFKNLLAKSAKELSTLSQDSLQLIFFGCKLLDQLLILSYDEFNLKECLFVSTSPDLDDGESISIISKISKKYDLTYLKDEPFKVDQALGLLRPLLEGKRKIELLTQLRLFFDSLGLINYERTYSLYPIDYDSCTTDALSDLVN